MPKYTVQAKVDQIVTKKVSLVISASSEEEATEVARRALQTYPKPIEESSVLRAVTLDSTYWIPRSIEIDKVVEEEKSVA